MFNKTAVSEIKALLEGSEKVTIIMHRGPDGDAVGSALGWKRLLETKGIEATVIAPDPFPDFLKWMPGADEIIIYEYHSEKAKKVAEASDAVFCLDFNAPNRAGDASELITTSTKPLVVVDHHQEPAEFAHIYYVDSDASSTAEMIYRLAKGLGWKNNIERKAAICLYTGLVTDTGSFRFSSVTPKVMRIASRLMETGMDHTEVYRQVFDSNSLTRLKLQGFALSEKLILLDDCATAYISLTAEELARYDFKKGDTEGLVNYALSINGVNLAGFFSEKDGAIKISLRSRGSFDVNKLARAHFNGGGHQNAAGGRCEESMNEVLKKFEEVARQNADQIKASIS
jgi:phosphoesterase RecJ-like protein